jgi:2-keto-4-pentenoate hydratase/2-oxohepta-3-ene-1,7-dioic acid hydratase in catechol pathway
MTNDKSPAQLIAHTASTMTLEPSDVIMTGTPCVTDRHKSSYALQRYCNASETLDTLILIYAGV